MRRLIWRAHPSTVTTSERDWIIYGGLFFSLATFFHKIDLVSVFRTFLTVAFFCASMVSSMLIRFCHRHHIVHRCQENKWKKVIQILMLLSAFNFFYFTLQSFTTSILSRKLLCAGKIPLSCEWTTKSLAIAKSTLFSLVSLLLSRFCSLSPFSSSLVCELPPPTRSFYISRILWTNNRSAFASSFVFKSSEQVRNDFDFRILFEEGIPYMSVGSETARTWNEVSSEENNITGKCDHIGSLLVGEWRLLMKWKLLLLTESVVTFWFAIIFIWFRKKRSFDKWFRETCVRLWWQ